MTKYAVTLQIVNTGSKNVNGGAAEMHLNVGVLPKDKAGQVQQLQLFAKDVSNGDEISAFKDLTDAESLDDAPEVSGIELELDDAIGLVFTFSIYSGTRWMDALILKTVKAGLGGAIDLALEQIPAGDWNEPIKDRIEQFKKILFDQLDEAKKFVDTIAADAYDLAGLRDGTERYGLFADKMVVENTWGVHDRVVIRKGERVARVHLKKID